MTSESQDKTLSLESYLATVEKTFEDSLALYKREPNAETWRALREQVYRLQHMRLAAGQPISDLLPRLQKALAEVRRPK